MTRRHFADATPPASASLTPPRCTLVLLARSDGAEPRRLVVGRLDTADAELSSDTFAKAGVDLATEEPFGAPVRQFEELIVEIEPITSL